MLERRSPAEFRSGVIALVGAPNTGKSALLNHLVGHKVAITAAVPQTTRTRVRGILTLPGAQLILVDTPAVHHARTRLGAAMTQEIREAIDDADVVLAVFDSSRPLSDDDRRTGELVRRSRKPAVAALHKADRAGGDDLVRREQQVRTLAAFADVIPTSAVRGPAGDRLVAALIALLPAGPQYYPPDVIADQPEPSRVAELIREQAMRLTREEIPYGIAVEIEEFAPRPQDLTYIRAILHVERERHKRMLIGRAGRLLKAIGAQARAEAERALGRRVYLDLWVKTSRDWRRPRYPHPAVLPPGGAVAGDTGRSGLFRPAARDKGKSAIAWKPLRDFAVAMMIYLSRLINAPIVDADGERLGVLGDVAVDLREPLPRITGLWLRGDRSRLAIIPWDAVARLEDREVRLRTARRFLQPRPLQPEELLLAGILDTQVVDTDGLKVVRVNDLHLIATDGEVRLIAADVGTTGLLRRVSLDRVVQRLAQTIRRPLPDRVIPWSMVAAFGGPLTPVRLSVSRQRLREIHPADLAQLMEDLDRDERVEVMTVLEHEDAAEALAEADPEVQADVMKSLPSELAADILEEMAPDDATDVLTDLPPDRARELLGLMAAEEAADVTQLLRYREGTAGSVMTTEFIALPEGLTAAATLARLRALAPEAEHIYYFYVVDEQHRLVGVLPLRSLIVAPPEQPIAEIMAREVISVVVDDEVETVAGALIKYDLLALPVLDAGGTLLGVITVDDIIDVVVRKGRRRIPLRFRRRARSARGRSGTR